MNIVIQNGNYHFYNFTEIVSELPSRIYKVKYNQFSNSYYLSEDLESKIPQKIYGGLEKDAERYLKSFTRPGNLGILLVGEKGSGKTLLSRIIGLKSKLPVIMVEDRYTSSDFVSFLNSIEQECVVIFDEFDKVYDDFIDENGATVNAQLAILKLLDGGTVSKKMFIFTSNKDTLSEYMVNRPSRIRYRQNFYEIGEDFLVEILNDKLDNKDHIQDFIEISKKYRGFNLDTILIICEECNFSKQKPSEAIKYMNISYKESSFELSLIYKDKSVRSHYILHGNFDEISSKSLSGYFDFESLFDESSEEDSKSEHSESEIRRHLSYMKGSFWVPEISSNGSISYINKEISDLQVKCEPISHNEYVF